MDTSTLKPANENPWYLMMTLYGEQEVDEIDWELAEKNRRLWNAWICQGMTEEERTEIVVKIGIEVEETEWSDETAEKVQRLFERRQEEGRVALDIPDPKATVNLSEVTFSNPLVLERMIFRSTFFFGAHFGQLAYFERAHFGGSTYFSRARFEGVSFFVRAHFGATAVFEDTHFGEMAIFTGAYFGENAYFSGAHFHDTASFDSAHFGESVNFGGVRFNGFSYFLGTHFGDREKPSTCRAIFVRAVFGESASFEGADFVSHLPVLTGATLHDTTTISADPKLWPSKRASLWKRFDRFLKLAIPAPVGLQPHAEAKASAATLRHVMAKQALPEEEHFFFRREMHHAARGEPFWRTWHIYLFEMVSDFGHSIWRPSVGLASVWAAGTALYTWMAGFALGPSAGFSFSAMFKFFGLQGTYYEEETEKLASIPYGELAAASQTVAGFVLLFFLGLGLRTRFRLR